ncbi:GNAT family N-acetyltransferase [Desulfopila aestuarii]|uniref:Ribosomal protein S18 acetylase RimI n=1 Tax=Desulfopila aestuarii DSM 18488 TaxID=1121416 RepID=A0A1M7YLM1_9BACT|nr:GNAT family N-acetyltransferase [Desulfopila aestuarii]SHO53498.1 Ribosomal protein S18 acetylase RimI [Desulfopila aestuarii DSM 18488]
MIEIRNAEETHIRVLAEIEKAAAAMFSENDLPAHRRNETMSELDLYTAQQQGLLVVAVESGLEPIGFAIATLIDSYLHLKEIDVHPRYQCMGIGSALLDKIFDLAQDYECEAVTLTTNKYVAWNAPWYEKKGFCILGSDNMPTYIRSILDQEQERGYNPQRRVAMQKSV